MPRYRANPVSGSNPVPDVVVNWARSSGCSVIGFDSDLTFLSYVAMYYTGNPEDLSVLGSALLQVNRSVREKLSKLVCDVPALVSGEPDFCRVAIFSQLLGIAFEIFVADTESVSLHPIVLGDNSAAAITLVGYLLNERIRYSLVLSDISGQRSISTSEFRDFLRTAVNAIVTDDISPYSHSTDHFGRASIAVRLLTLSSLTRFMSAIRRSYESFFLLCVSLSMTQHVMSVIPSVVLFLSRTVVLSTIMLAPGMTPLRPSMKFPVVVALTAARLSIIFITLFCRLVMSVVQQILSLILSSY